MKKLKAKVVEKSDDIDITAMLDVVFILLIFFVVTASFVKEQSIDVSVPKNDSNEMPNVQPIVVEINNRNQISVDGLLVSARAVESMIVRMRAEKPESPVVVNIDADANTKTMVGTLDGIRAANVMNPVVSINAG